MFSLLVFISWTCLLGAALMVRWHLARAKKILDWRKERFQEWGDLNDLRWELLKEARMIADSSTCESYKLDLAYIDNLIKEIDEIGRHMAYLEEVF